MSSLSPEALLIRDSLDPVMFLALRQGFADDTVLKII